MKKLYEILNQNQNDEVLIVGSRKLKQMVLKNYLNKQIQNVKFISMDELIANLTFRYDDEAIFVLMKEFGYSYDVCKLYLSNLKYIYLDSPILEPAEKAKIDFLKNIFNYLKETKHLSFNNNYYNYLKDFSQKHKIVVYDDVRKENKFFLKDINYITLEEEFEKKKLKATICSTFEEELFNMFERIASLIYQGIKTEDILIVYNSSDKDEQFKRMSKMYKIPINSLSQTSLTEYPIVNEYLHNRTIDNPTPREQMLLNQIPKKIGTDELYIDFLKRNYQNKNIKIKYTQGIEIISLDEIRYYENKHIFILNCNQGKLLKMFKDEDYLRDITKAKMGINTSVENNIIINNNLLKALYSHNNIYLSLSKHDKKAELFEEVFIKEENIEKKEFALAYSQFSSDYNKILLTKYLDDYYKYNIKRKGLEELYQSYDVNYKTFDNSFKKVNQKKIFDILNGEIKLSYSQVNEYNNCAFAYYLKRILKLDNDNKDSFPAFIGSLYHYVLSKAFLEDFDFEKSFSDFIDKEVTSGKIELCTRDKFLLKKLKEELKYIIKQIEEQNKYILYNNTSYEKNVVIDEKIMFLGNEFKAIFKGFIDKIYYKNIGDKKCVAIVDYKTGNDDFNLELLDYGLNMQLPIYLYLIKNLEGFKDSFIYGFYLQNILHNEISVKTSEDYEKEKASGLLLRGYSVDTFTAEAKFDDSMENSKVIKSMKLNKDGTYSKYAKILTFEEMNQIYAKVKEKISEAYHNILDCNFSINPKSIFKRHDSCAYCQFRDICYKNEQNYVNIQLKQNEKGETNGLD